MTVAIEVTDNSFDLIAAATRIAKQLWRPGFRYQKAGIVLIDLTTPQALPLQDMFATRDPEKSKAIMAALDAVNARYGRGTLRPGLVAPAPHWGMRRQNLSPCYTTRLEDLLLVKSGLL